MQLSSLTTTQPQQKDTYVDGENKDEVCSWEKENGDGERRRGCSWEKENGDDKDSVKDDGSAKDGYGSVETQTIWTIEWSD